MDNELFELCKEVYERTGWGNTGWWLNYVHALDGSWEWVKSHYEGGYERYPLYNSDYLLEKLPKKLRIMKTSYWLVLSPMDKGTWGVSYDHDDTLQYSETFVFSNTPLKALLKLTIALDDAGVNL